MQQTDSIDVYILGYHSEARPGLHGTSGQFKVVEEAICKEPFPYDNGDDPSFYVERQGGRLTWGVCRPDVRSAIRPRDMIVFVSYATEPDGQHVLYRLSAIVTVEEKLTHPARFAEYRGYAFHGLLLTHNLLKVVAQHGVCQQAGYLQSISTTGRFINA